MERIKAIWRIRWFHIKKTLKYSLYPWEGIVVPIAILAIFIVIYWLIIRGYGKASAQTDVLQNLLIGLIASVIVAVYTEMTHNYQRNKKGEHELSQYYTFLFLVAGTMKLLRGKYKRVRIQNEDDRKQPNNEIHDIWFLMPDIKRGIENASQKSEYLRLFEIDEVNGIRMEIESIKDALCKIISNEYNEDSTRRGHSTTARGNVSEQWSGDPDGYIALIENINQKLEIKKVVDRLMESDEGIEFLSKQFGIGFNAVAEREKVDVNGTLKLERHEMLLYMIDLRLESILGSIKKLIKMGYRSPIFRLWIGRFEDEDRDNDRRYDYKANT